MIDFGLTSNEFRAEYFERKPCHFRGALRDCSFAWPDVDHLLEVIEPRVGKIRMFNHGILPEPSYTEEFVERGRARRRLNKAKFSSYLENGATLQINWLEEQSLLAKRLCLEVARFAGAQTSGNAYMSFAGDGSFGKHWDTHDVFVVQLIGRKRWRVYTPTWTLPLTYQTNDRSGHTCPAEPAFELIMEEGDVLYVPRGWWHHVIPLRAGSFHLSVGTYAPSLFDYVIQTSAKYLEQQLAMRKSFSRAAYREAVSAVMQQLPTVLLDPANAAAFELDSFGREVMNAEFNLASLDPGAAPLSDGALLSLTTFRAPTLDSGAILVNGAQLRLEPMAQAVVAALRDVVSLRLDALCARLGDVAPDAVRRAVLDLARHDIVTIQT